MNAYTRGKSGADICFIEIFRRIKSVELAVVTSQLGKHLCKKKGLKAIYHVTSKEKNFGNIVTTYIKRTARGMWLGLTTTPKDIVYATSDAPPDVLPSFIYKFKQRKTFWVQKIFHVIPKERLFSYYVQKISFFLIKRSADVIIVDNDFLLQELVKQGFAKKKLHLNYLGIDHRYFRTVTQKKRGFDGIFMGRLHRSKGVIDLIKIWKQVVEKFPYANLAMIGTGAKVIKEELKDLIVLNKLEKNITLLGYLEDDQVFSLIKSSKLFLFPSHEEGFGMVIGEVMACGVPIVAYDLPIYETTFKKGMRTVPLGRIDLFSSSVLDLLREKKERVKLIKIGSFCVKRFTWSQTVKKELRILLGQKDIGSFNRTY